MGSFNIRVYGILFNEQKELLVCDEKIRGGYFTKFPGGGLEFGEGTRDCLRREFMEEMGLEVEVLDHLYTTDFFQESAFRPGDQIISIYYFVRAVQPIRVRINERPFEFDDKQLEAYERTNETESFRFIKGADLRAEDVTLPIDKYVVELLLANYGEMLQ
jgi:8-oxo-dGTP diphosphatase